MNDFVRRSIEAHEAAAFRARSFEKRRQHEVAASMLRKSIGIPEPVSFGGDPETKARRRKAHDEQSKREQEFKSK